MLSNVETGEVIFVSRKTTRKAYEVYKALDEAPHRGFRGGGTTRIPRLLPGASPWATSSLRPLLDKVDGHVEYPFDRAILRADIVAAAYYNPFVYNEDYTKRVQERYARKDRKGAQAITRWKVRQEGLILNPVDFERMVNDTYNALQAKKNKWSPMT